MRRRERIPVIFEINDAPPCSSAQELADRIARRIKEEASA